MVRRNGVFQNFRSLRQLNITIGTDPGEAWLHGLQFLSFLLSIGASPNLVALKLFVVTSDNYIREEFLCDQENTRLRHHARGIADKIFGTVHPNCPKFVALAIDLVQPDNVEPNINLFGFVRGKQLDLYGNANAVGLPVEANIIKYLEPCSEPLGGVLRALLAHRGASLVQESVDAKFGTWLLSRANVTGRSLPWPVP